MAKPRVRHSAIAIALSVLVALTVSLLPLDLAIWAAQAKFPGEKPSGSIVLVTDKSNAASKSIVTTNRLLLRAITNLERAGADRIVIDTPLRASNDAGIDRRLRDTIAAARERTYIAAPFNSEISSISLRQPNAELFADAAAMVSSDMDIDFLDYVWSLAPSYAVNGENRPAAWTVLVGGQSTGRDIANEAIHPDYRMQPRDLPEVQIADLAAGKASALAQVGGKSVLIANLGGDDRVIRTPGGAGREGTSAHVSAIAAETALRSAGFYYAALYTIPVFGIGLLFLAAVPLGRRWRRIGYAVWASQIVVAFVAVPMMGDRVSLADPVFLASVYGCFRAIANYRRRHLYVDTQSRLPNFTAFRRYLEAQGSLNDHILVIVKIARLDAIFATLGSHEQGEYLRQVASRLTLGESSANVYHDGGKYLGMVFRRADYIDLRGHLEGLRAIASQAVLVGDTPIDVAITIGVDQSNEGDVSNRISSAIAAADQAREAYRPVFIISDFQADSEEWDHSLQSRLENALSENRISVKLQPKVDMQSGLFVGAEALARWTDQQRGEIPPVRFIIQCERAGRLDDLTKRVMEKSMQASIELAREKLPCKVSVNVSAIQFVDSRVVDLVELALGATQADPRNIMIEITETARVENLTRAREVMEEIKRLGIEFSIDDFGVGSGNLDALYALPFDEMKIDRMFSNEVTRCPKARSVVAAMLDLCRAFGMRSVVEGIDELDTFEAVRDMGGDLAQGFCIARPQTLTLLKETLRLQAHQSIVRQS
ncbi:MAG: EAL domain-containing protein [Pseudomonadota bacterium]